jgi:hypothetical protein
VSRGEVQVTDPADPPASRRRAAGWRPKRLLDVTASELRTYGRSDVLTAIRASEGRTVAAETIAVAMPALYDVSNPELAASLGADIIVLNMLNVARPVVVGIDGDPADVVQTIKRLTGRLVALNLEPVDCDARLETDDVFGNADAEGRLATPQNVARAAELGVDAVVLTGNPGMGVTNSSLATAVARVRSTAGSDMLIMAGRMHASGSPTEAGAKILDSRSIHGFVEAGADIVLMPAPGTVPGCHEDRVRRWVETVHGTGALTMTTIGTSQEGADIDTVRRIALMAKMTGTDIHHLGDCGYFGITLPENLLAYSIAIRGRRHAYRRMASSVLR